MKSYLVIDVYCNRPCVESDMDSLKQAVRTHLNGRPWFGHLLRFLGKYEREFSTQIKAHPFNFTTLEESECLCIEIGPMHPALMSGYLKIVSI